MLLVWCIVHASPVVLLDEYQIQGWEIGLKLLIQFLIINNENNVFVNKNIYIAPVKSENMYHVLLPVNRIYLLHHHKDIYNPHMHMLSWFVPCLV